MASAIPPFISQLPWQQLLRPSWLAGAISIGFHSVLFAAGPTFPSLGFNQLVEPELTAERRNVPLVELTPAEQQRLPDFSGSLYDFDAFGDLEPLAPLFGDSPSSSPNSGITSQKPAGGSSSSSTSTLVPFGITRLESRPGPLTQFPNTNKETKPSSTAPGPGVPDPGTPEAAGDEETSDQTAADTQDEPSAADLAGPTDESSTDADGDVATSGNPAEVMTLEERLLAYTFDGDETEPEVSQGRLEGWLETGQALATELELDPTLDLVAEFEAAVAIAAADPGSDLVCIFHRPIELPLVLEPHRGAQRVVERVHFAPLRLGKPVLRQQYRGLVHPRGQVRHDTHEFAYAWKSGFQLRQGQSSQKVVDRNAVCNQTLKSRCQITQLVGLKS